MKRICVNRSIESSLKTFIAAGAIDVEVVTDSYDSSNDVIVEDSGEERRQSDMRVIYKGGWISCNAAWGLADKMEVTFAQMGAMLNHLDVKIKQCQLGCF
jgi:hypothetical protein